MDEENQIAFWTQHFKSCNFYARYNVHDFVDHILEYPYNNKSFHFLLQNIFNEYRNLNTRIIDISEIRNQLAIIYKSSGQFEIAYPGDSMEALLEILKILHLERFPENNSDFSNSECKPICAAHHIFPLVVTDILTCKCGEFIEKSWDYCSYAHSFYVSQIFEEIQGDPEKLLKASQYNFDESIDYSSIASCLNRLCDFIKIQWECPINICPKETSKCKFSDSRRALHLTLFPEVYIINLIWENSRPLLLNLLQAYSSIPYSLDLQNIYLINGSQYYALNSIILYGSSHYVAIIKKNNYWFKVDDESVNFLGTWIDVIITILKSRFYPVGLFYIKSTGFEDNNISLKQWIELEIQIIQISEFREIGQMPSGWLCECGNFNNKSFDICESCNRLKPGIEGWVCNFCTTLNNTSSTFCITCTKPKGSPMKKSARSPPAMSINSLMKTNSLMKSNSSVKNNSQKRSESNIFQSIESRNERKCRCCSRILDNSPEICLNCYLRSQSYQCQYCGFKTSSEYCALCVRSTVKCDCGKRYHIMDVQCDCKSIPN